jgi:hypothetical protein
MNLKKESVVSLLRSVNERDHLGGIGIDERMRLKCILTHLLSVLSADEAEVYSLPVLILQSYVQHHVPQNLLTLKV